MPTTVVTVSARRAKPSTARSIRWRSGRSRVEAYSVKTGIIAVDKAPSAKRRRRMLGMRNATKNASVTGPAPNARATIMSRTKPSRRLSRVAGAIPPNARTTCPSLSLTLKFPRPCGMMHRVPDIDSTDSVVRAAGRRGAAVRAGARPGAGAAAGEASEMEIAPSAEARPQSKEPSRGEHEVGDQAHPTERATAPAKPGDALEDPRHGQSGARGRGRLASCGRPRGDPRSRQGRQQGRAPPQYRRAQEIRARPESRRRAIA